ncbi:hypothetical protein [Empedobacter brevis]|uniref:hypothetical protein n=1 Tax=Empedobacter brevis TaxID=247 RepID=UPI00289A3F66|nr:hypothetical protein [Empedobacter brevis]
MEINTDNGIVTLKKYNLQLRKGMLLEDLQQTEFYKKYTNGMRDVKTGYFWYYFKAINVDGYQLTLNLCFLGNQLDRIFMNTHEESDAKTWDDWTEQKEMNVFHRNTTFLSHILGIPPTRKKKTPYPSCSFRFSWGSVWSVYDPRSASSFMGINYDEN